MLDKILKVLPVTKNWKPCTWHNDRILAQVLELLLWYICGIVTRKRWLFFPGSSLPW